MAKRRQGSKIPHSLPSAPLTAQKVKRLRSLRPIAKPPRQIELTLGQFQLPPGSKLDLVRVRGAMSKLRVPLSDASIVQSACFARSLSSPKRALAFFQRCCFEIPDEAWAKPFCCHQLVGRATDSGIVRSRCASSTSGSSAPALKPSRAGTSNSLATRSRPVA